MDKFIFWSSVIVLGYYFLNRIGGFAMRRINWGWWYRKVYLKSTHWKLVKARKKLQIWVRYGYLKCEECGKKWPRWWEVHHKTYQHIGNERMNELQLLCPQCHDKNGRA